MNKQQNKPAKRKLNIKLLRKIQKHILEEPRRFLMTPWVQKAKTQAEWNEERASDSSVTIPPCGTAACIAGWTNLLTGSRKAGNVKRATKLLGLTRPVDLYDYHYLFELEGWPRRFRSRYANAKTPKTRAKIAAARIDHLIEEGK